MPTPSWQPSTFYAPGSLVQPATAQPAVPTPIPNWSFESGNVEWTLDSGLSIVNGADHYGPGTWSLQGNPGFTGDRYAEMQDFIDCTPGESITAKCQVQQGASSAGLASGSVYLRFYDAAHILIQENEGNIVNSGSGGAWHTSTVTATAPANTAFVRLATRINRIGENDPLWVDAFEWNKISQAQTGLIFKAVQANVGLSDATEPTWPLVNGQTVVDNTVTWEAVLATRIVWQAKPILVSGATEPAFTPIEGSTVGDNTISWRAVSRRVTDPNCPNSKIVIIGASKVFAADDDIVAYSATVNPLDWSTANNAGYIPSNLQQYGANPVAGLGLYRSNLWVGNSQGSQIWQIDEDPQQMALLDAFPVGTDYHDAVSPAFNDLFFLPSLGVRTLGIAGGSTNLQSGDAGMPIDTMVQDALTQAKVNGDNIQALYYPAAGQYWLMFSPPAVPTDPISLSGDLVDGMVSTAYSSGPLVVANGFAPYRWSATGLPDGLSINEFTGIVSGSPTTVGIAAATITVVDRFGRTASSPQNIQIDFSSGFVINANGSLRRHSGATSNYPILATLNVTSGSTDISVSDGGQFVAVTQQTSPFFRLFKLNNFGSYTEVVAPLNIALASNSDSFCSITADAQYLAITHSTNQFVYKRNAGLDTYTRIATLAMAATAGACKFSPDGTRLANRGATNQSVAVFDRSGDSFTARPGTFSTQSNTRAMAWNLNGTKLACLRNGGLYVIDVSQSPMIQAATLSTSETNGDVRWNRDGRYIYTCSAVQVGGIRLRVYDWPGASVITPMPNPTPQPPQTDSLAMTADGRVLMVISGLSTTPPNEATFWSVSGATLTKFSPTSITGGAASVADFDDSSDHWSP